MSISPCTCHTAELHRLAPHVALQVMPLKQQILFTTLLSGSVDTMNVLSSARGERSRMKKRRWKKQTHVEEACSSSGAGVMLM